METLNKIELRGNVGNVRISDVGENQVARFSIATNYINRNKNGETNIETTWHNVVAWSNKDFPDLKKIEKGCGIYVCGRVRTNKYTANDGTEKQNQEVVANLIEVLHKSQTY